MEPEHLVVVADRRDGICHIAQSLDMELGRMKGVSLGAQAEVVRDFCRPADVEAEQNGHDRLEIIGQPISPGVGQACIGGEFLAEMGMQSPPCQPPQVLGHFPEDGGGEFASTPKLLRRPAGAFHAFPSLPLGFVER